MPSSPNYKRNYKEEYDRYQGSDKQKKNRAKRNAARTKLKKAGVDVKGKDVAHRNNNVNDASRKNLTVQSKSKNRSFPRNKKAGRK